MTDPVFALEPDNAAQRAARALAAFSSVEWPPRRLAHRARRGADVSFWRPRRRAARRGAGLHAGGVLASADRRQPGGGRGLDGRRLGEPPADGAAADPRAQRRGAGASGARLSSAGQARRPPAPLDPPQHPLPGAGRTSPPITTSATNFMPTFWMTTCSTPARCLPTTSRI